MGKRYSGKAAIHRQSHGRICIKWGAHPYKLENDNFINKSALTSIEIKNSPKSFLENCGI